MPLPGMQSPQIPQANFTNLTAKKGWLERFKNAAIGSPDELLQISNYTPNQMSSLEQLLGMGMQGLQKTPFNFEPIANQARQNFQNKTLPSIAERFTAMGSGNQGSSAFANTLGAAGAGMETDLAALGSQYNLAQQNNLLRLLALATQPQYQQSFMPGSGGFLGNFGQSVGPLAGALGKWYMGV